MSWKETRPFHSQVCDARTRQQRSTRNKLARPRKRAPIAYSIFDDVGRTDTNRPPLLLAARLLRVASMDEFACSTATTNSLTITISLAMAASLYEAQVGMPQDRLEGHGFTPFIAASAESREILVRDLLPDQTYLVKVRTRGPAPKNEWSNLTALAVPCYTAALRPGQPRVLPPQTAPSTTSLTVAVAPGASDGTELVVEARQPGGAWGAAVPVQGTSMTATLSGLVPGTAYEVRARTALDSAGSLASDVILQRTAVSNVAVPLTVYRISELCDERPDYSYGGGTGEGGRTCEPDNLYNHDAGSLRAVELFAAINLGKGHATFIPNFEDSVTSRYCVLREAKPWADYVSCNGRPEFGTEHYACTCNVFIDRCIGRLSTDSCYIPNATRHEPPRCNCSATSTAYSNRYIGRMPVYSPFVAFNHHSRTLPTKCSPSLVPPAAESTWLGDWYSLPAASECALGTFSLPGPRGCTWARQATHHLVHGYQLLGAGFNTSGATDPATLERNEAAVDAVLGRHPVRCCGC